MRETKCDVHIEKLTCTKLRCIAPRDTKTNMSAFQSIEKSNRFVNILMYVFKCITYMNRIIPISPLDGTTKVERCERMC